MLIIQRMIFIDWFHLKVTISKMQKRTIVIFRLILTCPISRMGAVSTTGHGESITKVCLAHRVVQAMKASAPKEVSQKCHKK